ncbi:MAG: amidase [Alphaproteobacteria bacterium]|nr:amidase [Alphaproteobacteria bacterium]
MVDETPALLTLAEAAEAIEAGRLSSLEATQACLARLKRLGGAEALNCVAALDEEAALSQARAADALRAAGKPLPPLHGVPLAHKDMFLRKGRVSACGTRILAGMAASETAGVLEKLDRAGALDIARLNMVELALGLTGHNAVAGTPRNPWDRTRITGGSSSGSAAAVAARMIFGALGSDTGGSIRFPAACCGVVGLKPTYGRVGRSGAMPLSPALDCFGPIARTVTDCAMLHAAVAGHDGRDPASSRRAAGNPLAALEAGVKGLRVGIPKSYFYDPVKPEVASLVRKSVEILRRAGADVIEVPIPDIAAANPLTILITAFEGAQAHAALLKTRAADLGPQTLGRLVLGLLADPAAVADALRWRKAIVREFCQTVFSACDVLHTPVMLAPPPTIAESDIGANPGFSEAMAAMGHCTRPFNFLGLPAISVPCGFGPDDLPAAFQLAARPFAENTLLRAARAYERETEWFRRRPND